MDASLANDTLALISKRELAQLIGVKPWTIDLWRKSGRFPEPIIISQQTLRWRRSDVMLWLAQREAKPAKTRKPPNANARGGRS